MPRPDFIQAPTTRQLGVAYHLLTLNRRLVACRYGDLLPPDVALQFREAIGAFEREFQFEGVGTANDNDYPSQRAVHSCLNVGD